MLWLVITLFVTLKMTEVTKIGDGWRTTVPKSIRSKLGGLSPGDRLVWTQLGDNIVVAKFIDSIK